MLIAVASVKGAPGVTTLALALTQRWPAPGTVMIEADPAGAALPQPFRPAASAAPPAAGCRSWPCRPAPGRRPSRPRTRVGSARVGLHAAGPEACGAFVRADPPRPGLAPAGPVPVRTRPRAPTRGRTLGVHYR